MCLKAQAVCDPIHMHLVADLRRATPSGIPFLISKARPKDRFNADGSGLSRR